MFSISKLMDVIGLNGRLLAFFKAVCVYFAVSSATGVEGGPTVAYVAAKCAPIICLIIIVLAHRADISDKQQPDRQERRRYCSYIALGLALSSMGDALLVWPQYFVAGMAAFALAHVAYITAFGWRPLAPLLALPLFLGVGYYLWIVRTVGALRILVPLYAILLVTMAWRGTAQARTQLPAAVGAGFFLLSDAALGYNMFANPLPYGQMIVMSTYYIAQLGIAMSALETPKLIAEVKEPYSPPPVPVQSKG